MPRKPRAVVLDSWSILAYFEDEPAGAKVADIIADAHEQDIPLLMTMVNAGEVWYVIARKVSDSEADTSIANLRELGIQFVEVNWKVARQAAVFKAKHKMSFADCFAAALAFLERGSALVTGDREFETIKDQVNVTWLRNTE
jgi:predicted nucleic acid-binding protein